LCRFIVASYSPCVHGRAVAPNSGSCGLDVLAMLELPQRGIVCHAEALPVGSGAGMKRQDLILQESAASGIVPRGRGLHPGNLAAHDLSALGGSAGDVRVQVLRMGLEIGLNIEELSYGATCRFTALRGLLKRSKELTWPKMRSGLYEKTP
jgi:hypothetical protein